MQQLIRMATIACALLATSTVFAQQVTVQQPVFRSFSASTTVSVPDRGSAFIAGIGRAADGRSSFGPFRSGTNVGTERAHAGLNVGVWIHDFEELDRMLLERGAAVRRGSADSLSGSAGTAWSSLHARHDSRTGHHSADAAATGRWAEAVRRPEISLRAEKGNRYYRLGLEAERRGAASVARSHYLAAARYGSTGARERLEQWAPTVIVDRR